jgi:hypothetical protein
MECLFVYEKILRFLLNEENKFINNVENKKYYNRYEEYVYPTEIEIMMLFNKVMFSTLLSENSHIEILMFIFERLLEIEYSFNEDSEYFEKKYFLYDDYLNFNIIIGDVYYESKYIEKYKSKKLDTNRKIKIICEKYNFKTHGSCAKTDDGKYRLYYDTALNFMRNADVEELILFFGYDVKTINTFNKFDSVYFEKHLKDAKVYSINDLLELINKIKIKIWNEDLFEKICSKFYEKCIFNNKKEYIDYVDLYRFLPNLIKERHNIFYKELIQKTWHPDKIRNMLRYLDIDDL